MLAQISPFRFLLPFFRGGAIKRTDARTASSAERRVSFFQGISPTVLPPLGNFTTAREIYARTPRLLFLLRRRCCRRRRKTRKSCTASAHFVFSFASPPRPCSSNLFLLPPALEMEKLQHATRTTKVSEWEEEGEKREPGNKCAWTAYLKKLRWRHFSRKIASRAKISFLSPRGGEAGSVFAACA